MAKKNEKHNRDKESFGAKETQLPIERMVPESIVSHYSNHVIVTRGEF